MVKPEKTTRKAPALAKAKIQKLIRQSPNLKPAQKIIFNVMMDMVQWDKQNYPVYKSRRGLIELAGVPATTYNRVCKQLRDLGLIHWKSINHAERYKGVNKDDENKRWGSNQYCISLDGLVKFFGVMRYDLLQDKSKPRTKMDGDHEPKWIATTNQNEPRPRTKMDGDHEPKRIATTNQNGSHKPEVLKPVYNKPEVLKPEVHNANTNTRGFTRESNAGYNAADNGRRRLEMDRAKAQTRQQQRQPQQQRQHQPETRVITLPRSGRQVTQTRQPNGDWI